MGSSINEWMHNMFSGNVILFSAWLVGISKSSSFFIHNLFSLQYFFRHLKKQIWRAYRNRPLSLNSWEQTMNYLSRTFFLLLPTIYMDLSYHSSLEHCMLRNNQIQLEKNCTGIFFVGWKSSTFTISWSATKKSSKQKKKKNLEALMK